MTRSISSSASSDPAAAEPLLRSSVDTYTALLGEEHHNCALVRSELGKCLRDLSRFDEAEAELLAAHLTLEKELGAKDARTLRVARALAAFFDYLGREDDAQRWRAASTR